MLITAQVIEVGKYRRSLVDVCLEETGGLGIDCVLDCGKTTTVSLYACGYCVCVCVCVCVQARTQGGGGGLILSSVPFHFQEA